MIGNLIAIDDVVIGVMDLEEYRVDLGYCKACLGIQGGREQRIYRFPNGYGASLISSPRLGGPAKWTLMALRFDGDEYDVFDIPEVVNGRICEWKECISVLGAIMAKPHF